MDAGPLGDSPPLSSAHRHRREADMQVRVNRQKQLVVVLAGLVILCWLALWAWGASPYGRFLSHGELAYIRPGEEPLLALLFVAGWTLMTMAMMLPTSLPLVVLFYGLMGHRPDR